MCSLTAYFESIHYYSNCLVISTLQIAEYTNTQLCLYKPDGVVGKAEASDDAMVDGSGGWIRITGGGGTPAGWYDIPTCDSGGVDATGITPGPRNGGRPEPNGISVPYTDKQQKPHTLKRTKNVNPFDMHIISNHTKFRGSEKSKFSKYNSSKCYSVWHD